MEKIYQIDFEPIGFKGACAANQSLLEIALKFGIEIANLCGGRGTCHSCKIQILSGEVSKPTANERTAFCDQELKDGWRLACQVYPESDCKVRVPSESLTTPQRIQIESLQANVIPEPYVRAYDLKLSPPNLSDTRDDAQRLLETLNRSQVEHPDKIGELRLSSAEGGRDGVTSVQEAPEIPLKNAQAGVRALKQASAPAVARTPPRAFFSTTSPDAKHQTPSSVLRFPSCHSIDIDVLRHLPPLLRSLNWQARVFVREDEVIAIGSCFDKHLGLAVDLGASKIAGYLLDLSSGETLAALGIQNPQISCGEDIITRMAYVKKSPSNAKEIQELTVNALNQLAADLCAEIEANPEQIVDVAIAGNTAMHHLLLRLPVEQLGLSPYVPAVSKPLNIKARDVGLRIAPGAYLYMMPNIAGFVGGDHIAMLLATDAWRAEDLTIAIDIGTNTEVSLIRNGEITTVSCASGPAFEGAHIKHGMRAANGAIERLRFADNRIEYHTIGGCPPIGLCGSGILDAISQLYLVGVLDVRGKIADHPRVRIRNGNREFVLISEEERKRQPPTPFGKGDGEKAITITQQDVREIQLAKGAIRAGIQVLLNKKGYSKDDIQKVIIAGAFGSYIDVSSAVTIGMLPDVPLDRFEQVGNAAGMGVKMVLASRSMRDEAESLANRVHYVDLTAEHGFNKTFAKAAYLKNFDDENR